MFRKENPGEYSLLATFKNKSLDGASDGGGLWKGEGSFPSAELEDRYTFGMYFSFAAPPFVRGTVGTGGGRRERGIIKNGFI